MLALLFVVVSEEETEEYWRTLERLVWFPTF